MFATLNQFIFEEEGQSTVEYMLLISVIVIAIVAAAYIFMPTFQSGVEALAQDVSSILDTGKIGGTGTARD
jgi:Flp pilus assembly pilin Flp